MQGILLIAIGDPFYKEMAYNMALSLRVAGWDNITLLTDDGGRHYSYEQRKAFAGFVTSDPSHYEEEMLLNAFKLKTFINHYTPYEETLYLDCDGLYFYEKPIRNLFAKLAYCDFQMHEVGRYTKDTADKCNMVWVKLPELWKTYHLSDDAVYTETNSSFIWWKKTTANDKFFFEAQNAYNNRKLSFTKIGRFFPDELAWNYALCKTGINGKIEKFRPIYFDYEAGKLEEAEISKHFDFIGLAGGYINRGVIRYYNNLVKYLRFEYGDKVNFKFEMIKKAYHDK